MDHTAAAHHQHPSPLPEEQTSSGDTVTRKQAQRISHADHDQAMTDPAMADFMEKDMRRRFLWSLILAIPVFLYSPVFMNLFKVELPAPLPYNWLLFILTTPIVFWFGSIFPIGAYQALKRRELNMMVLISVGVFAAYLFSVFITIFEGGETFFEAAALLVTFVLFGHWMEMKSRRGTSEALRALFDLVPPQARVIRNGQEVLLPTAEVQLGEVVIVKPGDKIPVDGEVIEGESAVDEAMVTGESLPVTKTAGSELIAGTINQNGVLKFKTTKIGSDTLLAQIVKLVETAQNSKAPGQRIADKAAQYLVVLAVGVGVLTFAFWLVIMQQDVVIALTFAVSAVVIACPDALGLATPTAVAVGTGIGAKHNILIKDAATLEQAAKINAVVLDKTGTLTEGKPQVTDVMVANGYTEAEVLSLAAALETKSNHPLSQAVIAAAQVKQLNLSTAVTDFKAIPGYGLVARVEDKQVVVGNLKLLEQHGIDPQPLTKELDQLKAEAKSLILLGVEQKLAGVIAVADTIKPTAKQTIAKLHELGLATVLISGDNKNTAETIAKLVGIERVFAEVLPQDKADYVKKLQAEGKFVAMVGDGVNDAPALAQADIGVAIGAGTDVAIETANIVLMKSDPLDILKAIKLSKATVRKMKENLVWASVYNLLAIPVAAGLFYPSLGITLRPEVSALLMSASSIIVAVNAVLLKRVERDLTYIKPTSQAV